MSGVLDLAHLSAGAHSPSLKKTIGALDLAMADPDSVGKIHNRLVRATFSALERLTPQLSYDRVPNPFPSPHNLSWYFSSCACPTDVRVFATMLSKSNIRVWSVAQASDGWKVLAQVFGATSAQDAQQQINQAAMVPSGRLKHHVFNDTSSFPLAAASADALMEAQARVLLEQQGRGHFVELTLARRF